MIRFSAVAPIRFASTFSNSKTRPPRSFSSGNRRIKPGKQFPPGTRARERSPNLRRHHVLPRRRQQRWLPARHRRFQGMGPGHHLRRARCRQRSRRAARPPLRRESWRHQPRRQRPRFLRTIRRARFPTPAHRRAKRKPSSSCSSRTPKTSRLPSNKSSLWF